MAAASSSTQQAAVERVFQRVDEAVNREADGDDDALDKILTLTTKLLRLAPNDADAKAARVVAFLRQSKFSDALALCAGDAQLAFEEAYCRYRLGEPEACLALLDGVEGGGGGGDDDGVKVQHLRAQALYRLARYGECADLYESLDDGVEWVDGAELLTNQLAVAVLANRDATVEEVLKGLKRAPGKYTYEQEYNAACSLIAQRRLDEAAEVLEGAIEHCQATLGESGEDQEFINDECAVLRVQLAYVNQEQGKFGVAASILHDVLHSTPPPSEATVVAVASNNIVSVRRREHGKLFESIKRNERAVKAAAANPTKYLEPQKQAFLYNQALLQLAAKKPDKCLQLLKQMSAGVRDEQGPTLGQVVDPTSLLLARAAAEQQAHGAHNSVRLLEAGSDGADPVQVQLALAHVHLLNNDPRRASSALLAIEDAKVRNSAALTAVLVALYEQMQQIEAAQQLLEQGGEPMRDQLERFKMRHNLCDARMAREMVKSLPKLQGVDGLNVGALLADSAPGGAGQARALAVAKKQAAAAAAAADAASQEDADAALAKKQKKKKKRKPRYPKGFDPSNPGPLPDPERWKAKHERSGYKPSRKKRRGQRRQTKKQLRENAQHKGAQGGDSAASEAFDITKNTEAVSAAASASSKPASNTAGKKGRRRRRRG